MNLKNFFHHLNRRDTRLFPKLNALSKIILILTLIIGSIFFTKNILAENTGYGNMELKIDTTDFIQNYVDKQEAIKTKNNLEAWIDESIISNSVSLNSAMIGDISKEKLQSGNWSPGGLVGLTNNSIATLYNPPISGVQYIAYTINNFMGKPTYAANGFGFDKLGGAGGNGIMSLWKTVRNAVYTLISLFFIILGIMIMLRIKISPQATISIQVIIPKIIMTLILVTFSFAIAGLLIDFSYVLLGLVLSLIGENTIGSLTTDKYDIANLININFGGFNDIVSSYFVPISKTGKAVLSGLGPIVGFILGAMTGNVVAMISMPILGGALGLFLINIIVFINVIKLFFGLAKCYINILLKIVISPLEIALGVFPGSKIGFSSWIIQLIANLVVFPATIIFLVVILIFIKAINPSDSATGGYFWAPNILANGEIIGFIIGLTGITLLAKIPQIIPEFVFKMKPSPLGKVINEGSIAMAGAGMLKGIGGTVSYGLSKGASSLISDRLFARRREKNPVQQGSGTEVPTSSNIPNPIDMKREGRQARLLQEQGIRPGGRTHRRMYDEQVSQNKQQNPPEG